MPLYKGEQLFWLLFASQDEERPLKRGATLKGKDLL